jgi:hypothetical protein
MQIKRYPDESSLYPDTSNMERTVRETLTFGRFCYRAFAFFLSKVEHLVAGRVCELGEL